MLGCDSLATRPLPLSAPQVADLRTALKKLGLNTKGKKVELQARLNEVRK